MEIKTDNDLKQYRKENSIKLVAKYQSLIEDVFNIFDKNEDGENDDKKETEQKKLDRIKKRSVALDQVNEFLNKIEELERHLKELDETKSKEKIKSNKTEDNNSLKHPTKARAKSK